MTTNMKHYAEKIVKCPLCGKVQIISVEVEAYRKYLDGMYIQDAFPTLEPSQRELILSGMCEDCQSLYFADPFGDDYEEEEED